MTTCIQHDSSMWKSRPITNVDRNVSDESDSFILKGTAIALSSRPMAPQSLEIDKHGYAAISSAEAGENVADLRYCTAGGYPVPIKSGQYFQAARPSVFPRGSTTLSQR